MLLKMRKMRNKRGQKKKTMRIRQGLENLTRMMRYAHSLSLFSDKYYKQGFGALVEDDEEETDETENDKKAIETGDVGYRMASELEVSINLIR
eukprot:m.164990 g.164990  ORF g.164990 m.164990 type:complete len:93 (+) comp15251_c0_seq6:303-581(+)